jgi:hypothetical protein
MPGGQWQPIETAPRDGRLILCLRRDGKMVTGWRFNPSSRTDVIFSLPGKWEVHASHWMPLPEPPEGI